MILAQIEYFLAVAKHQSFTAAAKSLYISQPALSKQISLLEKELGVILFRRESRGVSLTEAGKMFEADVRKVMMDLEAAKNKVIILGQGKCDQLHVGAFEGATIEDFYPDFYRFAKNKSDDMQVKLYRAGHMENLARLERKELDILFLLGAMKKDLPGFAYQKICQREAGLVYSEKSILAQKEPLSIEDFRKETFLTTGIKQTDGLQAHDVKVLKGLGIEEPRIEMVDNFMTMFACLAMGQGYTIAAEGIKAMNPEFRIFWTEPKIEMGLYAMWREDHPFMGKWMAEYGDLIQGTP